MILFACSIVKSEIITSAKLNKKIFYVQTTSFLIRRFNTNAKISKKLEMHFNKTRAELYFEKTEILTPK